MAAGRSIEVQIEELESKIEEVESKIRTAEQNVESTQGELQTYWMGKEAQLRGKEAQLRSALMGKEMLLLKRQQIRLNPPITEDGILSVCTDVVARAFSECQSYGSALREWCWPFKDDPTYLWDTNDSLELLWPSGVRPDERRGEMGYPTFRYIGRLAAQKLYERISSSQRRVSVMGAKGSGKSFLVAAVCNHLHQSGRLRVMFLDARSLVQNPLLTLWKSLLLAFYGDEGKTAEIQSIRDVQMLEIWSYSQELVIVVDDWESLEMSEDDTQDRKNAKVAAQELILRLEENAPRQFLVQVSSVNSRERLECEDNLKKRIRLNKDKFLVDGPFDASELATWMGLSALSGELKVSGVVGYLTGGMPRLLEVLEETRGDELSFKSQIAKPFTHKLWSEFLALLTTQEELKAALKLIIDGEQEAVLTEKVKLTCFYTDSDGKYRILCPYLEREARNLWIQRREQVVDAGMLVELRMWLDVILKDLRSGGQKSGLHSPRIGWNVEGLSIDRMRHQKAVFQGEEWSTFEHVVEYAHGMEAKACSPDNLRDQQLLDGVLMVPVAFNEKAVDLLLIKVAGDVLRLDAFQITIATWKLRSKKKSHVVWKHEVAPRWKQALENGEFALLDDNQQRHRVTKLEDRYYYVTPETVKPEDLPPDEEGPADDRPVDFKRFGHIHDKLSFLDTMLDVARAAAVRVPEMSKCHIHGCESRSNKTGFYCRRHRAYCNCRNSDGVTPCSNRVASDGGKCNQHLSKTEIPDGPEQLLYKKLRVLLDHRLPAAKIKEMFSEIRGKISEEQLKDSQAMDRFLADSIDG